MRHNHKNHIGSRAGLSLTFFQIGKTEIHIGHQNPKNRVIFAKKTKNQMLKKGKTGNHNGQQNRKTEVFHCKNRKTDLKNGQNRKTENPNAPLMFISLVPLIFPYSSQILLENALFCRQNARLKIRLFCSKFCRKNLSKPTLRWKHLAPSREVYWKKASTASIEILAVKT